MKPIRCLAVDDEPLALALLADNIRKVPGLELVGTSDDAFAALDLLQREPVDLLFLDVQMPGLTGLQLLESVLNRPLVILVTAYEHYALTGYNLNVLDYLLKPVAFTRFLQAVQKARQVLNRPEPANTPELPAPPADFFVSADYALVRVQPDTVRYVEGLKDYVKIYITTQQRPIMTRMTLKAMEERLSPPRFLRIHRSFIVDCQRIEVIRKQRVVVGSAVIPVSDLYAPVLYETLRLSGQAPGS